MGKKNSKLPFTIPAGDAKKDTYRKPWKPCGLYANEQTPGIPGKPQTPTANKDIKANKDTWNVYINS